jgi:hypothetical protein
MSTRVARQFGIGLFLLFVIPSLAHAQASIAGSVKDASGAILPGVTVEASSPALIEKARSVVTDGTGQYRIVDLRPGVYAVTFTLTGFNTVKREGIELAGTFVAPVSVEMKVGSVQETVTVTGETPVVDVQSAKVQQTLDKDLIAAIPTSRAYQNLAVLVPAMVLGGTQDVGGTNGDVQVDYTVHGGKPGDGRIQVDGLSVASPQASGANRTMYVPPAGTSQEVAISTSGGLGEAETSGVVINVVPREGGNTLRGSFFITGANGAMQSNNFTPELQARGLKVANSVKNVWDINPSFGGPIAKDKLWYYFTARYNGANNYVAGMFENLNRGNADAWTYVPSTTQAVDDRIWKGASLRFTWQLTPRNKVNLFWDEQSRCVDCVNGGTAVISPEGQAPSYSFPNRVQQATWISPVTSRILFEAGWGDYLANWGSRERPDLNRSLIQVVDQAGAIPGLTYRAFSWAPNWSNTQTWRASISYVTGANNMKFGYFSGYYNRTNRSVSPTGLAYRFSNGVPNQVTISANDVGGLWLANETHILPWAIYAQDQWTLKKLTLAGGVRYDHESSRFPQQQIGPSRFYPTPLVLPESEGLNFNDFTPRMSAAYDVRGNGKTAVKVNLGKYVIAQDGGGTLANTLNPINRMATNTTRTWTDTNRNFVPDCNLLNPALQNLSATGGDVCGAFGNPNYLTASPSTSFDPEVITGWSTRPYGWDLGVSVQHELVPRVSVNVGYFRRWFGNFIATDNLALAASDYTPFSILVPAAPAGTSLPGDTPATLVGFVNANSTALNSLVTKASNYGNQIEHWNGFDVTVNVRPRRGLTFQGGVSTGKTTTDDCEISAKLPETLGPASSTYCHQETPFLPQFKGLGSYTIPRVDVQMSGTLQSVPGPVLAGNYNAPNAVIQPSLGRPLTAQAPNQTVNLVKPGTFYGDRINQLDLRFAKILRFGRTRAQVGIDLYNAVNSDVIQTYNQTFVPGSSWLVPTAILPARFVKVSAQFDF